MYIKKTNTHSRVLFFLQNLFVLQALAHRQQCLGAVGGGGDGAGVVDHEVSAAGELRGGFGAHDATLRGGFIEGAGRGGMGTG